MTLEVGHIRIKNKLAIRPRRYISGGWLTEHVPIGKLRRLSAHFSGAPVALAFVALYIICGLFDFVLCEFAPKNMGFNFHKAIIP